MMKLPGVGEYTIIILFVLFSFYARGIQAQNHNFVILEGKKETEIPFTRVNNLIVVPVRLENKLPLWFMLDTGVRTTILTDRLIGDMLHMNYVRKYALQGAGSLGQVEAMLAHGTSMLLPGVQIQGQSMLVLEEDYLELSNQLGMQVQGIMGHEIFRRFVVKINYSEGLISIIEPEAFKPERAFTRLDLEIEDTKPYIYCTIEGAAGERKQIVKLMIDTGASHALLLHQEESNEHFSLPEKTITGHLGRGLAGDVMGQIGRIQSFTLDDFSFENVLASFPEDSSYNVKELSHRGGTIGGDILSRFTVIFDYSARALYLKKNRNYNDPFIYSKTGLDIIAVGQDLKSFEVVEVRTDSPAGKAGVQAGDQLIRINGRKAKNLSLSRIITLFRRRNGKKIRLRIKRGDEEIKTSFILQDII